MDAADGVAAEVADPGEAVVKTCSVVVSWGVVVAVAADGSVVEACVGVVAVPTEADVAVPVCGATVEDEGSGVVAVGRVGAVAVVPVVAACDVAVVEV